MPPLHEKDRPVCTGTKLVFLLLMLVLTFMVWNSPIGNNGGAMSAGEVFTPAGSTSSGSSMGGASGAQKKNTRVVALVQDKADAVDTKNGNVSGKTSAEKTPPLSPEPTEANTTTTTTTEFSSSATNAKPNNKPRELRNQDEKRRKDLKKKALAKIQEEGDAKSEGMARKSREGGDGEGNSDVASLPQPSQPAAQTPMPSPKSSSSSSKGDSTTSSTPRTRMEQLQWIKEESDLVLPLTPTPDELAWKKEYQNKFRELGARRRHEFMVWFLENENGRGIPRWRPGRATPIVCPSKCCGGNRSIYSGHFSIPESEMVHSFPNKTSDWSHVVPALKKTYVFSSSQEPEYRADMRKSRFGITFRKGGWQSARTLELFAAGTIPYFCDIWVSPKEGSVSNFPREFLLGAMGLHGIKPVTCFPKKHFHREPFVRAGGVASTAANSSSSSSAAPEEPFNYTIGDLAGYHLWRYAEEVLTGPYVARYMLSASSLTTVPKKVLVIWMTHPTHPGYLMPTFMMGMKELGVTVVDYPRQDIVYEDAENKWQCKAKAGKSWGRGFFSFCRVKESDTERSERNRIGEALAKKEYDLVLFHFPHESYLYHKEVFPHNRFQNFPFFNETIRQYPPDKVLFVHDGDMLYDMAKDTGYDSLHQYGRYIRREAHGCKDEIWATKAWRKLQKPAEATAEDDMFP